MSVGSVAKGNVFPNEQAGGAQAPAPRNQKVLDAAQMYEAQFLRQMLSEMRKTVPESEFLPEGPGERMYKTQLDDKYVDTWVEKGGIGLQDLIYDQLMEKYYQKPLPKPQGPIPLNKESGAGIELKRVPSNKGVQYQMKNSTGGVMDVNAPWAGKVEMATTTPSGENALRLKHSDGRVSLLHFHGLNEMKPGQEVEAGQRVGTWRSSGDAVLSWAALEA